MLGREFIMMTVLVVEPVAAAGAGRLAVGGTLVEVSTVDSF